MHKLRRLSRGFTVTEMLIVLAIIAILAAATIPTLAGRISVGEGQALAAELGALGSGIQHYQENVGAYPARLDYLTQLPGSPVDICGNPLSAREISAWRGPYTTRTIPVFGSGFYLVNLDTIDISLTRSPATQTSGSNNYILINMSNVDSAKAAVVDATIDGASLDYTNGNVVATFSGSASRRVATMKYRVPVWGC